METRAERQSDGSWRLDGLKHYIGNGSKAGVLVTFAGTGEKEYTAFILETGMEGFEVGKRFDTMGLRGNDLRELRYNGIRVPPENVLGEPGEGFRIAMHVLNNGRLVARHGLGRRREVPARPDDPAREGAAPVRHAAGRLRARAGQDRLGGLLPVRARVDGLPQHRPGGPGREGLLARVGDLQGRRARSSSGTRPTARCSSRAASGYMRDEPYEKYLRDIRIFPIFEGANDVMRAFIALAGMKPLGDELKEMGELSLARPDRLDRRAGRVRGRADRARGEPGPDHARARRARRPGRRRCPTR